jgi:type IV fimbrial biogenesis protein FimT
MRAMKSRSQGFTLVELMVALGIAAIILAIGAPSFAEFRRNNRLTSVANDFLGTVQTARTEALKRQQPVSICRSLDPSAATPVCNIGTAFSGWIAFVDVDSNCQRTAAVVPGVAGQPNTTELDVVNLVRSGGPIETAVTAASNGNCISFAATGFLQTPAGLVRATKNYFCDYRGMALQAGTNLSTAREIEVLRVGRSRITRDLNDFTDAAVGPDVSCP